MKPTQPDLSPEERQILEDLESGAFRRVPGVAREKADLEAAAHDTLQKDRRINIRMSSRDLEHIQRRAAREGLPYQTYIASTLHKVVTGQLREVPQEWETTGRKPGRDA